MLYSNYPDICLFGPPLTIISPSLPIINYKVLKKTTMTNNNKYILRVISKFKFN